MAVSGQYYEQDGTNERRGFPASAQIPLNAKDVNTAKRLWNVSKQLANVDFDMIASM